MTHEHDTVTNVTAVPDRFPVAAHEQMCGLAVKCIQKTTAITARLTGSRTFPSVRVTHYVLTGPFNALVSVGDRTSLNKAR